MILVRCASKSYSQHADKSGDVDWSTLGNMLVAHELGEVSPVSNALAQLCIPDDVMYVCHFLYCSRIL